MIVVIDDSVEILNVFSLFHRHSKIKTKLYCFSDPEKALVFFQEEGKSIRIVWIDYNMPKIDGAQLAYIIKKMNPEVMIIGMSADDRNALYFRQKGDCYKFLSKPITFPQFKKELEEVSIV